ncbi:MAG: hypothetical protein AVDCRST_MAG87-3398, partial [uncultured Thermomicrobiales bacterium]
AGDAARRTTGGPLRGPAQRVLPMGGSGPSPGDRSAMGTLRI